MPLWGESAQSGRGWESRGPGLGARHPQKCHAELGSGCLNGRVLGAEVEAEGGNPGSPPPASGLQWECLSPCAGKASPYAGPCGRVLSEPGPGRRCR